MRPSAYSRSPVFFGFAGEGEGGSMRISSSTSAISFSFCAFILSECVDRPSGICEPGETEPIGVLGRECWGVEVAAEARGNAMRSSPNTNSGFCCWCAAATRSA